MGYYGYRESSEDESIIRIIVFFLGLGILLLGLLGSSPLPTSWELIAPYLDSIFWRLVWIVVGFLLMILAVNPDAITGRVGISVSR